MTEVARSRSTSQLLLLACALALSTGCEAIYQVQSDYLYQPQHASSEVPPLPEGAERWWLEVEGGQVEAWVLPPLGPTAAPTLDSPRRATGAVVFAHGNRERIETWSEELLPYREMGLAVLLPEYRSYGSSGGTPSEAAIVADFAHFVDRLSDRPDIDPTRLVFHGRSLGGGVVGALSTERRCAALILESTFTNVPDMGSRFMAPAGIFRDRFDTRAVLLRGYTPTLILHGTEDVTIPFQHALELRRRAWDSRLVAFHAGHDDLPRGRRYWHAIRAHLESAGVIR